MNKFKWSTNIFDFSLYRTDPSCRMAAWDVIEIQDTFLQQRHSNSESDNAGSTGSVVISHF